jgi:hypothetical protein
MQPAHDVVEPRHEVVDNVPYRTNFALAKADSVYLIYSREGMTLSVRLPPGRYSLKMRQLTALAAATPGFFRREDEIVIGDDGKYTLELRPAYDWILVFRKLTL